MSTNQGFGCFHKGVKPEAQYIAKVTVGSIALLACVVMVITLARLRHRGGFYLCVLVIRVVDLGACLTGFLLTTIPTHVCHPYDNVALVGRPAWIVFHAFLQTGDWILVLTGIERIVDMAAPGQWFKGGSCGIAIAIGLTILLSTGGHLLYYFLDDDPLNDLENLVSVYRIVAVYLPMSIITLTAFVLGIILLRRKRTAITSDRIPFMQKHGNCITYIALAVNLIIIQCGILLCIRVVLDAYPLSEEAYHIFYAGLVLLRLNSIRNIWLIILFSGLSLKLIVYISLCFRFRRVFAECSTVETTVSDNRSTQDRGWHGENHMELEEN